VTLLSPLLRLLPRGGAILCLHGIRSGAQPDGGGIHVDATCFAGVLEVAGTVGSIVPLSELVQRHAGRRSTSGLVAISFDDACLSVLRLAAPLLRAKGAPASVFAVRAAAESGGAYWWDRLSLLEPRLMPQERERLAGAVGLQGGMPPDGGVGVRDAIVARHRGALPEAAAEVFAAAESRLGQVPDYDRSMTTTELVELARDPLFDVGVHTVTHRVLPLLSDAEIHHEIADCHVWLLEEIRSPLPLLAIPYGLRDDRTRRIAIDAGMQDVLRIAPRTVRGGNTATGYPRFMVSERRSGWKLGAGLAGVQEIARALRVRPGPDDPVMPAA
jgi:peptidoglycan/xylan/chitin deacetylase (PgdA/CDA1 family)